MTQKKAETVVDMSAAAVNPATLAEADPMDMSQFAVTDTVNVAGAKKEIVHLKVGKPGKTQFVRACSDPDYSMSVYLIEFKEERETYIVLPAAAEALSGLDLVKIQELTLAVDRQGNYFLWQSTPESVQTSGNKSWASSMRLALDAAKRRWVRVASNMHNSSYDLFSASGDIPDPVWTDKTMSELLKIAFAGFIVTDANHPIVKQLLGEL